MISAQVSGRGDPLVLVHGVGTSRSVWRRLLPALAAERLVVAVDLPGFGQSPPLGPGFELARVADALGAAVAERVERPVDVIGHSLGGALALLWARREPERVRRLVLVAPAGFSPRGAAVAAAAGRLAGPLVAGRRAIAAPLAGSALGRRLLLWGTVADPAGLPAEDVSAMLDASRAARRIGAAVAAVAAADLRPLLAELQAPLGLLWGERDRVVPPTTLRSILELAPRAAVETIPAAGHVPQLERPVEFGAAVVRVLARLDPVTD